MRIGRTTLAVFLALATVVTGLVSPATTSADSTQAPIRPQPSATPRASLTVQPMQMAQATQTLQATQTPQASLTAQATQTPQASLTAQATQTAQATVTVQATQTAQATVTVQATQTAQATVTVQALTGLELFARPRATQTPQAPQTPKTVYVVIPVDTEDGDWSWYAGGSKDHDPRPLFDTSPYRSADMAKLFAGDFRNSHKDSFGGSFKMSWFAMMDQHFDAAVYKDERGLTGKNVGYTGVLDALTRGWDRQIDRYGDGIYWHQHVESWTGSAWVSNDDIPNEYTHDQDALNHMVIDSKFFPSTYRGGWCFENSAVSKFLEKWIPFDFSSLPGYAASGALGWKPYHPNVDKWETNTLPTMSRWVTRSDGYFSQDTVDSAFKQAQEEGKAIFSTFLHNSNADPMAADVDRLHGYLKTAAGSYPDVNFKYVNAQDAMQQYLGLTDGRAPTLSIRSEKRSTPFNYQITSSEPLWGGTPYVAVRYAKGRQSAYERVDVKELGGNRWSANIPRYKLLVPAEEVAPEYHPVGATVSAVWNDSAAYQPGRAFDGAVGTWWDSGEFSVGGAWIQLDLGAVKDVHQLDITFLDDGWHWYNYKAEASKDGKDGSWTLVDSGEQAKGLVSPDLDPSVSFRYLKISVTGSVNNSAHIAEIHMYGAPYPDDDQDRPKRLELDKIGVAGNDRSGNPGVQVGGRN
jgi:hypothetical protein